MSFELTLSRRSLPPSTTKNSDRFWASDARCASCSEELKPGRGVRESQLRRRMLPARSNASNDKPDTRLPAFLLETTNLDNYRPWMKRVREWARRQGGIIMENHLIGEVVPGGSGVTSEKVASASVALFNSGNTQAPARTCAGAIPCRGRPYDIQ